MYCADIICLSLNLLGLSSHSYSIDQTEKVKAKTSLSSGLFWIYLAPDLLILYRVWGCFCLKSSLVHESI